MPLFFFDPTIIILLPAILLAVWAQYQIKTTYSKYSKIPASSGITGGMAARNLLDENGLQNIHIEEVEGRLTDHYDPRSRVLRLSSSIFRSRSLAALAIAAHEVGHAIQHKMAYSPFQIRQSIFPVASIGSSMAFPLFFIGFLFYPSAKWLMDLGIYLFGAAVFFQIVTLPVEFNASSRALKLLRSRGYLVEEESHHAKKILQAAALTYVAASAVAVFHLIRLLLLRSARD